MMTDNRRIFSFLLPDRELCGEQELYYRNKGGQSALFGNTLLLKEGAEVSFDSYFNVFDYAVYQEETSIEEISYVLTLKGRLFFRVYLSLKKEEGGDPEDVLIAEKSYFSDEIGEISIPVSLSSLQGRGTLFFSLTAEADSVFYGGYIRAGNSPLRRVKIGIAITTFKREAFVKKNVAAILRDLPSEQFGVFVVDNGGTLSPEDIPGANLIPNKNLGGSGGFTRGIMEIRERKEYSHILLTDDDISFESEIFRRTAAILSYLKDSENRIIGASMLFLDKPYYQHEFGAHWDGDLVIAHNGKMDMREKASLLKNASHESAQYTAWWFNCFSARLPERIGLPFPFFIKIDDAEYCMRAKAKILLLNGIGVWHECFEYKFSSPLEYYSKRNELILNALYYPNLGVLFQFRKFLRSLAKQLIYQRYRTLELVFKAYSDFLKGAAAFKNLDAEALHRTLGSLGEQQIPRTLLEEEGYDLSRPFYQPESFETPTRKLKQVVTLNGYLLPAKSEPCRLIDMTDPKPKSFYRAGMTLQYNPVTEKGFVTKQSRLVLLKTGFRAIGYFFKLLFRFRKASRSFREAFPEIISESAWKARLNIE